VEHDANSIMAQVRYVVSDRWCPDACLLDILPAARDQIATSSKPPRQDRPLLMWWPQRLLGTALNVERRGLAYPTPAVTDSQIFLQGAPVLQNSQAALNNQRQAASGSNGRTGSDWLAAFRARVRPPTRHGHAEPRAGRRRWLPVCMMAWCMWSRCTFRDGFYIRAPADGIFADRSFEPVA